MSEAMSLGDFVKQLVTELHSENVSIPFENQSVWHELFYELRQETSTTFLAGLRFDWNGPYPKCQALSRFLHALHWNAGVSAYNPEFQAITLSSDMVSLWRQSTPKAGEERELLSKAVEMAKVKFSTVNS